MTADVRATVAELRQQLAVIVDQLGPYAPPAQPSRHYRTKGDEQRHGPIWDVTPSEHRPPRHIVSVRCLDHDEIPRCVYIEGSDWSYGGDWSAWTPTEAREFAMALLAAADWADDADPLHKRRLRSAT